MPSQQFGDRIFMVGVDHCQGGESLCSPPVVQPHDLPGELIEVGGSLSRHEDGGMLALAGQGNVARSAA